MTVHLEKPHHMLHLVISPPPPPPKRSATSRPSRAWVLTPPLVVMVTNLLPTNHVILRPPAKRNSAMGDLEGQKKAWNGHATTAIYTIYSCIYLGSVKTMTVTINTVLYFQEKKQVGNLFGRAEKLEKTYLAIISRHVSVSSKWTVFRPSSACVTAFSSAEPRLQVVVEVCILHQEVEKVTAEKKGPRRERKEPPNEFEHGKLHTNMHIWMHRGMQNHTGTSLTSAHVSNMLCKLIYANVIPCT